MESAKGHYTFAEQEQRRAERKRISIPVTLHLAKSKRLKTVIKDLSRSGFSASMPAPVAVDTLCSLTIPDREPMAAHVVWWRAGLVGCVFESLISQVAYDVILEHWDPDLKQAKAKARVPPPHKRLSR